MTIRPEASSPAGVIVSGSCSPNALDALGLASLDVPAGGIHANQEDADQGDDVLEAGEDDADHERRADEDDGRHRPQDDELGRAHLQVGPSEVRRQAGGQVLPLHDAREPGNDRRLTLPTFGRLTATGRGVALEARRDRATAGAHRDADGDDDDGERGEARDDDGQHQNGDPKMFGGRWMPAVSNRSTKCGRIPVGFS